MDIKIPLTLNINKDVKLALTTEESIRISLYNLISRTKNNRPFREEMSIDYDFIYQNGVTDVSLSFLQQKLNLLIKNYEKRIVVQEIKTTYYESQKILVITIKYTLVNYTEVKSTEVSVNL